MEFIRPDKKTHIIKVIGVGGGGGNAVSHMYDQGIEGVDFIICNTDRQALEASPVPNKYQLGEDLTEGLGAGADPEKGREAAIESMEEIQRLLEDNTKMIFITAGMGGGTGTGAAPIIAKAAKEIGILTVGIVTTPFRFEGPKRQRHAEEGIDRMKDAVDTLLVINNEKLGQMYGKLPMSKSFEHANNILATAAKSIAEIITFEGYINVDFQDVKTVMANSGVALMGTGLAEGDERATEAAKQAILSPLLAENDIKGAKNILLNITSGHREILMDEITAITDYIRMEAGEEADLIFGCAHDESLGEKISVTLIATAFETKEHVPKEQIGDPQFELDPSSKQPKDQSGDVSELKIADEEEGMLPFELDAEEAEEENQPSKLDLKIGRDGRPTSKRELDLKELESVPAYIRRKKKLEKIKHSSESNVSRFTLSEEDEDKKPGINPNNRFLHDNVD